MNDEIEDVETSTSDAYVPGTLYIMRETDYLTGESFDYFKIGIVRGEKDVVAREKEHSTGNPRSIASIKDIVSPAVQKLETRLHNEFAQHRVSSGEWFYLPGTLIDDAIAMAEMLNAQLVDEISTLNAAKSIDGPGEAPPIQANREIETAKSELERVLGLQSALNTYKKEVDSKLKDLAEGKDEWKFLFELRTTKPRSTFSTALLKKNFKPLYEQYQTIPRISITYKFTVDPLDIEQSSALAELGLVEVEKLGDDVLALHRAHLAHWSAESKLKWESEILEARMLAASAGTQGIEDILVWNVKESLTFDKAKFQEEHPQEYTQCFSETPGTTSWRIAEWASYSSR